MATAVGQSLPTRNRNLFQSMFSEAVRPPRDTKHYDHDRSRFARDATDQFESDSIRALGIGNRECCLPPGGATSFKAHFSSCRTLNVISTPSTQQRNVIVSEMLKTQKIQQHWTAKLGPDVVKKIFASVIDKVLTEFVIWSYSGTYNAEVQRHLSFWVEHVLAVWIRTFLYTVDRGRNITAEEVPRPSSEEVERYQGMSLSRLWILRVDELFDIVVDWEDTISGIDDIKPLLTTPHARQYVAQKFTDALHKRLLHPGASTIEILRIYVSTIRAFRRLDPRGVLLSKVSPRVRQYLRERDDTIKVVVAGLLSDVPTSKGAPDQVDVDFLSELAWELQNRDQTTGKNAGSLDWNNMNWQPDPIDAAPDQPRSARHTDVIGSVISLFESKDVFVKELQATLAERLLQNKGNYDQETSVIEHLKVRFGDAALQSCEVMLRDVLDSRRLDQVIRKDQGLSSGGHDQEGTEEPELHAKILSRLFWPSLAGSIPTYSDDSEEGDRFKPPFSILHQRNLYEQGFENLKQTRKLTWNDNLGQVEIEVTFADGRTYHDEVLPYQAGVIYAFDSDSPSSDPVVKTVADLSAELSLPINLVRSACLLFVSKRVLTPSTHIHDAFIVLEHLPPAPGTVTGAIDMTTQSHTAPTHTNADIATSSASAAAAQAAADRAAELAAQQAQKEAEAKEKRAKMAVYQQFITAMLTNQGAMPLPRIAMMLGMVVPGGFPYSNEELKEFLNSMVRNGGVVVQGPNYRKA